jgi:hypothetical protein
MDRIEAIWRWAQRTGLYLRHKDLNVEQILRRYDKRCVQSPDGYGWEIVDKSSESDHSALPSLFSKKGVDVLLTNL